MKMATSQAETSGNLTYKRKFPMRISEAGRAIIIKSIIDMYSDPYVAVLREYTSNAYDSHIWAGQTRPFEVTLPTKLQPNLIIQDWGIGLSGAELEDYAQFGESTKRDTNDQIGGFGLGSKSGLAVCSRFTVESVKDGKRSVVVIGRDADGPSGGMLIEDEDTDLPNGLKVTIPTTEAYKFTTAIEHNFFLGYPEDALLVSGKFPGQSVWDTARWEPLDEFGWLNIDPSPGRWAGSDYATGTALIGPVKYRIDWSQAGISDSQARGGVLKEVVIKLDNGSVDLTPSREALIYSKRTREHIAARVKEVLRLGKQKYAEQIEKAPTLRDAMILMLRAQNFGFSGMFAWHGQNIEFGKVSDTLSAGTFTTAHTRIGGPSGYQSSRVQWRGSSMFNNFQFLAGQALNVAKSVLIVNCEAPEQTGRYRFEHKIAATSTMLTRALAERDGKRPTDFQITYTDLSLADLPEMFKAAYLETMSADQAKALMSDFRKSLRTAAAAGRTKPTKRDQDLVQVLAFYREGASGLIDKKIADLDKTKKYILLKNMADGITGEVRKAMLTRTGQEDFGHSVNAMVRAIVNDDRYEFIFANKTWNTDNYAQYLDFVTFEEAAQAVYKTAAASLTPVQRLAASLRTGYKASWAQYIDPSYVNQIKRDALREFAVAASDRSLAAKLEAVQEMSKITGRGVTLDQVFTEPMPANPCKDYPLLEYISSYARDAQAEMIRYINMIDKAEGRI